MEGEKKKVGINKVKFRLLELWPPSVKGGFENETQISDFDNLIKVGEGSFGVVFKAVYKKTGAVYAIKAIDKKNKTNQEGRSYFKREIEIMYKVRHKNIVRLYTHFEDDHYCYFVMEYISKGNLFDIVDKQRKKCLDIKTVAMYMRDLLSAVYYLHNMDPPIIHRDIKLENVLLHEDGTIKLTDFGWSNYCFDDEVRDTFCGTPVYLAPEMLKRLEHDHNVDLWCIGVMMFELITGKLPFNTSSKVALEDSIMRVKINWPTDIDVQARDLISRILKYQPKDRLQVEGIFKHTFFTTLLGNLNQYLIKPNPNENLEIYLMTKHLPNSSNSTKEKTETNDSTKEIKNDKVPDNDKINVLIKQKEQLENELNKAKKEIESLKSENNELKKSLEHYEKTGKISIEELEEKNSKLLEEIEILNERIELHKNYYKEHLYLFDKELKNNMDDNQNKLDGSVNNLRESLSNLNMSSKIDKSELDSIKEKFEQEISQLKSSMAKERENYNFVLEQNMKELTKLNEEKNKIKENTNKYYEKIILKYDAKLKQKDEEIEILKKKI